MDVAEAIPSPHVSGSFFHVTHLRVQCFLIAFTDMLGPAVLAGDAGASSTLRQGC